MDRTALTRVEISRDRNDHGELCYLVTPYYRTPDGRTVSVPDSRGWPTLIDAEQQVMEIVNRN